MQSQRVQVGFQVPVGWLQSGEIAQASHCLLAQFCFAARVKFQRLAQQLPGFLLVAAAPSLLQSANLSNQGPIKIAAEIDHVPPAKR